MSTPTVHVVDDDTAMAESLRWLIESDGLKVQCYENAQTFMNSYLPGSSGCLLLDIRMPGISGLELQEKLHQQKKHIPIIFITGHGDVAMAVRAMKMGAEEFLTKPFNDQALLESIHKAIQRGEKERLQQTRYVEVAQSYNKLTDREKEVMALVVAGKLNKTISADLGIGCKTVEIHRSRIMRKMGAKSLAELVRMSITYDHYSAHFLAKAN